MAAAAAGLAAAGARVPALAAAPLVAVLALVGARRAALVAGLAFLAAAGLGSARVAAIDRTADRALATDRFDGRGIVLQRPRRTRFGSWAPF